MKSEAGRLQSGLLDIWTGERKRGWEEGKGGRGGIARDRREV